MHSTKAVVGVCGLLALAGCSDDTETAAAEVCGAGVTIIDASSCTTVLSASGDDDTTSVQTALIEAQSGNTVCFCPGDYRFTKELSLTVTDVTVKGLGVSREDVVLDFADQDTGDDGLTVTSDGFTVENLWVKNSPGNGILVTGAEDVVFRNLKVTWDAGSVTENGAYAVYPVSSKRVLIEDTEVVGAADAGLYVGQCEQAIVRNNVVHGNVAGIEFENTIDGEAYGNEVYDNTAGILVFVLPKLEQKVGLRTNVHDNVVYDNNRSNFGEEGTIVASVPPGLGMLVLAADETEIHDNEITGHDSTGVLLVSYPLLSILLPGGAASDPETNPYIDQMYVYDNTFEGNGGKPRGALGLLGPDTLEDIVWDGDEDPEGDGARLCLGASNTSSFREFGGVDGVGDTEKHSTDATPYECDHEPLPALSF